MHTEAHNIFQYPLHFWGYTRNHVASLSIMKQDIYQQLQYCYMTDIVQIVFNLCSEALYMCIRFWLYQNGDRIPLNLEKQDNMVILQTVDYTLNYSYFIAGCQCNSRT